MTTTTSCWKSFGASVVGPGHLATFKPNQDAWLAFHHTWSDGIVVSDGLGSKALSHLGSSAACRAVERSVRLFAKTSEPRDSLRLPEAITMNWLDEIAPFAHHEASATCLFAFRLGDGLLRLGILGDGCIAVVKKTGAVVLLEDDKRASFSNMTAALTEPAAPDKWKLVDVDEAECRAVILCSDGVADDLEDVKGFMTDFIAAYDNFARVTAARRLRTMLTEWPVPKHSDDKTLACLYATEDSDD